MSRFLLLVCVLLVGLLLFEGVRQATKPQALAIEQPDSVPASPALQAQLPKASAGPSSRWFQDISDQAHIDFVQAVGPLGTYFMPEINGSGGALLDYDNDSDLDLFLVNLGRSPKATHDFPPGVALSHRLYRQEEDGTFSDETASMGLVTPGGANRPQLGIGCAVGDVNNDGFVDLYVTNYGPDQLFLNRDAKTFEDATEPAQLGCDSWGTAAAFFDYDRDGWLDLIVVNYTADERYGHSIACGSTGGGVSYCGPHKFQPTIDRLYHNDGAQALENGVPRFTDVSESAGLGSATTYGLGLAICDFDRDGWPDIFVASDMTENRLWMNGHDGTFRDEAQVRGLAVNGEGAIQGCMGVAVADVDQDIDFDLLVTNLVTEGSTLYINDGNGMFADASRQSAVRSNTLRHTGWGAALVDLDLDGDLDLPQVNGYVVPSGSMFPPHGEDTFQQRTETITNPVAFLQPYFGKNLLLLNDGKTQFVDHSLSGGDFGIADGIQRALICGDVDRDGDIDLITTAVGARARLYRNDCVRSGHWLNVSCRLPAQRRDAYGAVVHVSSGSRSWTSQLAPSSSYLSSNEPAMHFGLGEAERIDQLEVTWPDGTRERFAGGSVDQHRVLVQGEGQPTQ